MTTVLVTRPQPDADHLAALLREKNFDVLVDPLFTTEFSTSAPERKTYQALLATSRNAIRALAKSNAVKDFSDMPLLVVGEETKAEAQQAGFTNIKSAEGSALSLSKLVTASCTPAKAPLLYLAGHTRKPALGAELAAQGFDLEIWEAYAMHPSSALQDETINALRRNNVEAILLFSERAVAHFLQLTHSIDSANLKIPRYVCLSAQVAEALQDKGLTVVYPSLPSLHAMIELLTLKNH